MASLPLEIVYDILTLLPVKSLLRFKCVCKSWNKLINSSEFIKSHLSHSVIKNKKSFVIEGWPLLLVPDIDTFSQATDFVFRGKILHTLIGSCNGLVCLRLYTIHRPSSSRKYLYALCNPSTRIIRTLPHPNKEDSFESLGFGYDEKSDDYKMVLTGELKALVYSSKSDSWKSIRPPDQGWKINKFSGNGVVSHNCLHWVYCRKVMRFDLHRETWDVLPLPLSYQQQKQVTGERLSDFDGCLCLSFSTVVYPYEHHVWIMKEYSVEESWTKLFSISRDNGLPLPLAYTKEQSEIILVVQGCGLFTYNLQLKKISKLEINYFIGWETKLYVESLVPLIESFVKVDETSLWSIESRNLRAIPQS